MIMVAGLKLILNDNRIARPIFSNEVDGKVPGLLLPLRVDKIQVENLVEHVDILPKPPREVGRLVLPGLAKRNSLKLTYDGLCAHYKVPTVTVKQFAPSSAPPRNTLAEY